MCNFNSLKNTTIWKESDIKNVVKSIKNELCERFNITWKVQIQQLSKLQVFKLVKPSIEFESYLSQVKIVKHRQSVTRFRILKLLKLDDMRILNMNNMIYVYVQFVTQMRLGTNITTFHIVVTKV
jgi:ribosomal protein RSM22 (predicted rRNA methylase)